MHFSPAPMPEELRAGYRASGLHTDACLPALMRRNVHEFGPLPAVFDGVRTLSWTQLVDASFRLAGFLHAHGVGPGDTVAWQLPNWWEALVVAHGVWASGAVSVPVVPIFREREVAQVVMAVEPRCVIVPATF